MSRAERVLLLLNLGSPRAPTASAVRPYLRQFLTDARVLDVPTPLRWLLGGALIPLLRAPRSARAYAQVWTAAGSPLLVHTGGFAQAAQRILDARSEKGGERWEVQWCMRYGRPGIAETMRGLRGRPLRELVVVPMYPQQASSSTGTALEQVLRHLARWPFHPASVRVLADFHDADAWIEACARQAEPFDPASYDQVLFSYHGLPQRHIDRGPCAGACGAEPCPERLDISQRLCYRGACHGTTRALAKRLGLAEDAWRLGFQSRLGPGWLRPFSDELVVQLARSGSKRLLVLCPSFVADCLETLEEVAVELRRTFVAAGGERLDMVPAPNAEEAWAEGFLDIVGGRGAVPDGGSGPGG